MFCNKNFLASQTALALTQGKILLGETLFAKLQEKTNADGLLQKIIEPLNRVLTKRLERRQEMAPKKEFYDEFFAIFATIKT